MKIKQAIHTHNAPQAIGIYSQAMLVGNTVYLSGQIPLDPRTMELITTSIDAQIDQVFRNMAAVAEAAGGSLDNIVKLTVFLTDLTNFPLVNASMAKYFHEPYPARSTIEVSALPKGAAVEVEAIMVLPNP